MKKTKEIKEENDERFFWNKLAEESLKDIWDNKDNDIWNSYLSKKERKKLGL